ncbi:hypothetical protein CPB84DRAFT_1750787 [Gymnopilus junonius]|uniref:Uncharacterized protein n=1 Tax=Gymnopilus junonius TaxID=109634 RepID=A0A9P5TJL1_GYMJU|nr:hypothetical protein CPB84DRAFT_1750787 [Gymnopilus junonius]
MQSYANWKLPGIAENPKQEECLTAEIIFAYSTISNPRKLEDPFYAPWNTIFKNLIYDLGPEVHICPQFRIFKDKPGNTRADTSTDTQKGSEVDLIPDFTAMGTCFANRQSLMYLPQTKFPSVTEWFRSRVIMRRPFILCECKTIASRHYKSAPDFEDNLYLEAERAKIGAFNQAILVSNEESYDTRGLVLMTSSGEWWEFMLTDFDHFKGWKLLDGERLESDDNNEMIEYREKAAERVEDGEMTRFVQVKKQKPFYEDVEEAIPEKGKWSGLILYGTNVSNQCLYLIHRKLIEMLDELRVDAAKKVGEWLKRRQEEEERLQREQEEDEEELDDDEIGLPPNNMQIEAPATYEAFVGGMDPVLAQNGSMDMSTSEGGNPASQDSIDLLLLTPGEGNMSVDEDGSNELVQPVAQQSQGDSEEDSEGSEEGSEFLPDEEDDSDEEM